jgi:hypothetical protein
VCRAEDDPKYGKSYAQILTMGYDRWMEFQGGQAGGSTAAMSSGSRVYRDALKWRNDRLLPKAPAPLRRSVARLRPEMNGCAGDTSEVGYFLTGGGTLWILHDAGSAVQVEQTLHGLLGAGIKAAPAATTGKVWREWEKLRKATDEVSKESFAKADDYERARKAVIRLKSRITAVIGEAGKLDRKGSDRLLDFCYRQVHDVLAKSHQ